MLNRLRTAIAIFLAFVIMAALPLDGATKKRPRAKKKTVSSASRKKSSHRHSSRAKAPATPVAHASGTTLEERLASLMNSAIPSSSDASLKVVDVETGRVVGERNGNTLVAPASNL